METVDKRNSILELLEEVGRVSVYHQVGESLYMITVGYLDKEWRFLDYMHTLNVSYHTVDKVESHEHVRCFHEERVSIGEVTYDRLVDRLLVHLRNEG